MVLALPVILALSLVTACGSDATTGQGGQEAAATAASERLSLKGVCPKTVVVQTSWFPQVEYGAIYHLLGKDYKVNTAEKRVTGPLVASGVNTGVEIEVRAGGPAIGYQQPTALMYQEDEITLGMPTADNLILDSQTAPALGVVTLLEKDPQVLIWDPKQHPEWKSIADIGKTDAKVLYFEGSPYMEYFLGSGILGKNQVDSSYDGTPSLFVGDGGKNVVQGYATNEPWAWEHVVKAWGKPLSYAFVSDTGYPNYPTTVAIRPKDRKKLDPCLKKLVPILQKAEVDFMSKPDPTIDLIISVNDAYKSGFFYTRPLAEYAVATMRKEKLVSNGRNDTLGDFEDARLSRLISILAPIALGQKKKIEADLTPDDLVTNEYIDPKISLSE